jgi:hypothetical protein
MLNPPEKEPPSAPPVYRMAVLAVGRSSDGGLYSPKWISTTCTMLLLRDLGLPATNRHARKACALLLDRGLQRDGGINYGWRGQSETCITGTVLSILSYFEYVDERLDTLAEHLLERQMPDGGWNCQRRYGATPGRHAFGCASAKRSPRAYPIDSPLRSPIAAASYR